MFSQQLNSLTTTNSIMSCPSYLKSARDTHNSDCKELIFENYTQRDTPGRIDTPARRIDACSPTPQHHSQVSLSRPSRRFDPKDKFDKGQRGSGKSQRGIDAGIKADRLPLDCSQGIVPSVG